PAWPNPAVVLMSDSTCLGVLKPMGADFRRLSRYCSSVLALEWGWGLSGWLMATSGLAVLATCGLAWACWGVEKSPSVLAVGRAPAVWPGWADGAPIPVPWDICPIRVNCINSGVRVTRNDS